MEEFRFTPKNQPARHDQLRRSFVNFFYSLIVSLVVSTMQPFPVLAADDGASLLEERRSQHQNARLPVNGKPLFPG